jgi:iron complex outermembrane receptor protein
LRRFTREALALSTALAWVCVGSAGEAGVDLDPLVISATRVQQSSADLPVAVDRVDAREIHDGQLQVNLSESLVVVPGVVAENRQNYAQDLQISVRGFGARSSFGVRGVRMYADGIPGTMPDGQSQYSNFDLGSADHIEVLRGPFSALYGNSSGGVISIYTRSAPLGKELGATAEYGAFSTQRYALQALVGQANGLNVVADASHFATDGYRDHSAAERNLGNIKVSMPLDARSSLTFIANAIYIPTAQDPLGLTAAQLASNPRQAGTNAVAYNTRKSVQQEQFGLQYERSLSDEDTLNAMAYGGVRAADQFQAIPMSVQAVPTHPGGVIELWHGYWGADLHLTDQRRVLDAPMQTTLGVAYDNLDEDRRGYQNFIGNELGVQGQQRVNLSNQVYDIDQYLQWQWDPWAPVRVEAGVRNSAVVVNSDNRYAAPGTNPESGTRYTAVNPVAGLTYRAFSWANFYAAFGKGFETPTLDELAYRSTNGSLPGLNFALQPARSDHYEIGLKTTPNAPLRVALDGFYIHTVNEVAVAANAGGRSVYENIPETQRRGAEAALQADLRFGFSAQVSYAYIQALVLQPYVSCSTVPCVPTTVSAGLHLPAVPANSFYTGLRWQHAPSGFSVTVESIAHSQIYANDLNTAAADGYWLFNLHAALQQELPHWRLNESLRIDNLANHGYVGSVIVNETNSRYYEPEPGRSAYFMVTAAYH